MFDREQAIADWRKQMLSAGVKTPVPLEELESHLRDEIEQQMESGLNHRDAFTSAIQKLGPAHTVQIEFMKIDKIHSALKWRLMEISLTLMTILFPLFMGASVLKRAGFIDMTPAEELSSLAALASFSLLSWSGRLGHRLLPVIQNRRIRNALLYSCYVPLMLWWIAFFRLVVPRYDFTMGEFVLAFTWAFFTPAGVCIGLYWGIETAAHIDSERPAVSAGQS